MARVPIPPSSDGEEEQQAWRGARQAQEPGAEQQWQLSYPSHHIKNKSNQRSQREVLGRLYLADRVVSSSRSPQSGVPLHYLCCLPVIQRQFITYATVDPAVSAQNKTLEIPSVPTSLGSSRETFRSISSQTSLSKVCIDYTKHIYPRNIHTNTYLTFTVRREKPIYPPSHPVVT